MFSTIKLLAATFFLVASVSSRGQLIDSLNTAKNCLYMQPKEREMIYEINRVRSNPNSYLPYLEPMLQQAKKNLKNNGKGTRNYSITTTTSYSKGQQKKRIDTTWHYSNEEEVKALSSLISDLKKLKPLSVLQPDSGIYLAVTKHAEDQLAQNNVTHIGSDGSRPWDRITKYSPEMRFGNENIAGNSALPSPRDIVIQLLIDSGIPGYGHRYNLLDPQWTHVACTNPATNRYWWIQNFGAKKKNTP